MPVAPRSIKILSTKQICGPILPWSRSTLWRRIRAGDFPPPIKLSPGRIGFSEQEILEWIEARSKSRTPAGSQDAGTETRRGRM